MVASQIIFVVNFILQHVLRSAGRPQSVARQQPGMEAPSPPGHGNFDFQPVVYRGPYEYGSPEVDTDYYPQTQPPPEAESIRQPTPASLIERRCRRTELVNVALYELAISKFSTVHAMTAHPHPACSPWPHRLAVVLVLRDVSADLGRRLGDDVRSRHGGARLAEHLRLQLVSLSLADVALRPVGFVHRAWPSAAAARRSAC